ncbi:hypothetical protein C2857_007327 [Epichloe festucae Fl1]|uniref:Extracellular membrane protein CFEM domain-containing protein n=1 Tax=Epichloe festucae (strain Fl1) TaxID=877507 RepID=A0A7S9KQQ4_EPIFF|nr:hypothetical protein C2857_007327 [Epichloe festucae Fl1]
MGRFLPILLSLIGTLHVIGVSGQSAAECIGRCTGKIRDQFKDLQCADANAAPCFCNNPTFPRAVLECSQSCGATMDMVSGYLTSDFCKVQGLVKPSESAAASTLASSTPAVTSSAASATSSTTTSSTAAAQTTPISSATPAPSSTSSHATTSSTVPGVSSSATAETTGSSTSSATSSSTSDTVAGATSSAASAAAAGSTSSGLSQAAIAGIGIGIGAAVIAVAGIVICMLLKGRKKKATRKPENMDISKPLPGSGRMYPKREDNYRARRDASFEKYGPDIEMTANRYEDMLPRTQPRTMV